MRAMRTLLLILALLPAALSAATVTVSSTAYPVGARDIGIPSGVVDSDTIVRAAFSREAWPVATCEETVCNVIEAKVYVSINGGPDQFVCSFTTTGGDHINRHGNLVTESYVQCSMPAGTLRTVRVAMSNTVTLSTALTLSTTP